MAAMAIAKLVHSYSACISVTSISREVFLGGKWIMTVSIRGSQVVEEDRNVSIMLKRHSLIKSDPWITPGSHRSQIPGWLGSLSMTMAHAHMQGQLEFLDL